ncbi:hypothetical protein IVB12_15335 [Bradyrhizobium sp. 179]|uniref:hypothetical protein n=1 Tax=Bradyrhizobium sp. 179 TaxID=2782648 RepID=UPI001FF815EF|nr:hypothetical protein [Bradyrhizobium sp. 179]MCK1543288.1 hypothetical protein [Bradyrhizobium sp. 179]
MINKTLQHDNQLVINCPVFPTKSRIAACFILRDLVWRGDGPADKRQGCQAAMHCGKCPINLLIKRMVQTGEDTYHSTVPGETRDFDTKLLDATGKILISDKQMQRHSLSSAEEKYLLEHNENAKNYVNKTVKQSRRISAKPAMELENVEKPAAPAKTDASALVSAAQTGDMSAAINAEMSNG